MNTKSQVTGSVPVRAALYLRISEDDKGDMLGIGRQKKDGQALAARKGWHIDDIYIDNDIGAWRPRGAPLKWRPEFRRMLDDITNARINAVVIYDLDRLLREPEELEQFFNVCDRSGLDQMASVQGEIDLSTDNGRLHARIMVSVAKKSSDDMSRRLKRKFQEDAETGLPHGRRAFGWQADRVTVDENEAAIIREMADRLLGGEALLRLVADLNARQVPTSQGAKFWNSWNVRMVLTNPRVAGLRAHRGEIVGKAVWPAILDHHTWERLVAHFDSRKLSEPRRRKLLTGLVYCGLCGHPLGYTGRSGHIRCNPGPHVPNCGHVGINRDKLEAFVVEAMFWRLKKLQSHQLDIPASEEAALSAELTKLAARMDELAAMFAAGEIGRAEWVTARRGIESRQTAIQRQIAALDRRMTFNKTALSASEIEAKWDELTMDQQRAWLAKIIDRISIAPAARRGRGFDSGRIEIRWSI